MMMMIDTEPWKRPCASPLPGNFERMLSGEDRIEMRVVH
jgi:hypothetical protein